RSTAATAAAPITIHPSPPPSVPLTVTRPNTFTHGPKAPTTMRARLTPAHQTGLERAITEQPSPVKPAKTAAKPRSRQTVAQPARRDALESTPNVTTSTMPRVRGRRESPG